MRQRQSFNQLGRYKMIIQQIEGKAVKLRKSIVILKRGSAENQIIDSVLLVKHPEDCDPVERLHAGVQDFLQSKSHDSALTNKQFTWGDLIRRMQGWDLSSQEIYIEEALMWMVLDQDESSTITVSRFS